jgi:hypothetical protein
MELEPDTSLFVFDAFHHANRYPLRSKTRQLSSGDASPNERNFTLLFEFKHESFSSGFGFHQYAGKSQWRKRPRLVALCSGAGILNDLALLQERLQIVALDDLASVTAAGFGQHIDQDCAATFPSCKNSIGIIA